MKQGGGWPGEVSGGIVLHKWRLCRAKGERWERCIVGKVAGNGKWKGGWEAAE